MWTCHKRRSPLSLERGCTSLLAVAIVILLSAQSMMQDVPQTMIAASRAKTWGIATYRIEEVRIGVTSQVSAALLATNGERSGTFSRTRIYRTEYDRLSSMTKYFLTEEAIELTWGAEVLRIDLSETDRVLRLHYNGEDLGSVRMPPDANDSNSDVLSFVKRRGELIRLSDAISADLDASLSGPWRQGR